MPFPMPQRAFFETPIVGRAVEAAEEDDRDDNCVGVADLDSIRDDVNVFEHVPNAILHPAPQYAEDEPHQP